MDYKETNKIYELIKKFKTYSRLSSFDEAATKQAIILPLLQNLGWDIYNIEEVSPEYIVDRKRVDYALRIQGRNEFFLEVKKLGEDLETYEEQLLDYSFRQGVKLAGLTNGITWLFYLPLKEGLWAERKFYTVDIIEQEAEFASEMFIKILSKQNIETGEAFRSAEEIYTSAHRQRVLKEKLPEAWKKIITEPSPILIELLSDITEKLSGFRPTEDDVLNFLKSHQKEIILSIKSEPISPERLAKRRPPEKRISTKEIPYDTAVHLVLSLEDAIEELRSVDHKTFQDALGNYWHSDKSRRVKAQSVCWLFCWAKTGMRSEKAAIASRRVFNRILNITYEQFDEKVGLAWARENRNKTANIESQLAKLLRS